MPNIFTRAVTYFLSHRAEFFMEIARHAQLALCALGGAVCIGFPSGALAARRRACVILIQAISGLRVIPSLAILFLCTPIFGLGFTPSAIALTVLAIPPIALATDAAYRSLDRDMLEAAAGLGMTSWQAFVRVHTPLATPLILGGVRTAFVEVIASASLAAFVGGGGLGTFVVRGFSLYDPAIMLVGAIPIAGLTLISDLIIEAFRKSFIGKRSA